MTGAPLWAVTAFFNPQRYASRLANYRLFRRHLQVPVVAVELAFDGAFQLAPGDGDIVVQVRGGDVMWQKERLLNLGIASLPAACRAVALLDCDIVFGNPRWPVQALRCLEDVPAAQLFGHAYFLRRGARDPFDAAQAREQESTARAVGRGLAPGACLGPQGGDGRGAHSPGLAWALRRDLIEQHRLFDGCVIGGGDTALSGALWGAFDAVEERHAMNTAQRRYYRGWAQPLHHRVRGAVGCIEGELFHLWHGELEHRAAGRRHLDLAAHAFDPERDLAPHPSGAWRWGSDKPALHRLLHEYFAARREDG